MNKKTGFVHNHRAQGLPLNFIVLAAIAILILILVVGFVIGGGTSISRTMSPAAARQYCESACADLKAQASGQTSVPGIMITGSDYCKLLEYEGGQEGGADCEDLNVQCFVTYSDGIQKKATCSPTP